MSGVADVLQSTLRELADRRRKLEPFVDELAELDIVERDLERTAAKLANRPNRKRRETTVTVQNSAAPPRIDQGDMLAPPAEGMTYRSRVLAVLAKHPEGLSVARVGILAGVPATQVYSLMSDMASGPSATIEKPSRGFYRLIGGAQEQQADTDLSDDERAALGDRAVA